MKSPESPESPDSTHSTKAGKNPIRAPEGDAYRYRLLHRVLCMSPSFWLAGLEARGLPLPEGTRLPRDFGAVRATYERLGPVAIGEREAWLTRIAPHIFGCEVISAMRSGMPMDEGDLAEAGSEIRRTQETRMERGNPAMAMIAVPLGYDWARLRDHIGSQLEHLSLAKGVLPQELPFKLMPSKLSNSDLLRFAETAWLAKAETLLRDPGSRLRNPKSGLKLKRAEIHRRFWPSSSNSRSGNGREDRHLHRAGLQVDNKVKLAYIIAENAARGMFPFTKPLLDEGSTWELFSKSFLPDRAREYQERVRAAFEAENPDEEWDGDIGDAILDEDTEAIAERMSEELGRELLKLADMAAELNRMPIPQAVFAFCMSAHEDQVRAAFEAEHPGQEWRGDATVSFWAKDPDELMASMSDEEVRQIIAQIEERAAVSYAQGVPALLDALRARFQEKPPSSQGRGNQKSLRPTRRGNDA
jgi:hypothetical protein